MALRWLAMACMLVISGCASSTPEYAATVVLDGYDNDSAWTGQLHVWGNNAFGDYDNVHSVAILANQHVGPLGMATWLHCNKDNGLAFLLNGDGPHEDRRVDLTPDQCRGLHPGHIRLVLSSNGRTSIALA